MEKWSRVLILRLTFDILSLPERISTMDQGKCLEAAIWPIHWWTGYREMYRTFGPCEVTYINQAPHLVGQESLYPPSLIVRDSYRRVMHSWKLLYQCIEGCKLEGDPTKSHLHHLSQNSEKGGTTIHLCGTSFAGLLYPKNHNSPTQKVRICLYKCCH